MNVINRALIAAGLMVTAASASAAVSYSAMASASIDWSGLTISTIGLGGAAPAYTLNEGSDYSSVDDYEGTGGSDFDSAPDWSTGTSASVSDAGGSATAMTTASTLSAEASGDAFSTWTDANRDGWFDITGGPGLLIVTVPYTLEVSYDTADSIANAYASIDLWNETSGSGGSGWDYLGGWWGDEAGAAFEMNDGFLSASVYVEDGDSVSINAWAQAEVSAGVVATPLPAAVWMFGAAVFAFGGMASRRRA